MKTAINTLLLLAILTHSPAHSVEPKELLCTSLEASLSPTERLMQQAKMAQNIELDLETFQKDPRYAKECHFKIVKSDNFGDFPSYSGYDYQYLIEHYPNSPLVDDAVYALIYVITEASYNFSDVRKEKQKLLHFLKHYPKSNKYAEAFKRVKEIDAQLESGQSPILD